MANDFSSRFLKLRKDRIEQQSSNMAKPTASFSTATPIQSASSLLSKGNRPSSFNLSQQPAQTKKTEGKYATFSAKTGSLDQQKEKAEKSAEEAARDLRLSNARENLARRAGFPVNGIDIEKEQDLQSSISQTLQGHRRDIERIDYIQKYQDITRNDDFLGQFRASYDVGQMGQDEAMAWKEYLSNPTPQNRLFAEATSKVREDYMIRNEAALSDDATLPWISQDLAQYLPQLREQTIAGAKGALGGAAVGTVIPVAGTAAGAKAGYVAGRAAYGFDTMQGFAFKSLLDAGVDEQTAREAAMDEAFISSLIEGGDAAFDLFTLGGGKLIGALFKQSASTGAKITKPMWKNLISGGAAVLANAVGEGAQEWVQEGVSMANQSRNSSGVFDLLEATGGQVSKAISGQDPEALARMNEAGAAGFRIGLMIGGGSRLTNAALAKALNRNSNISSGENSFDQIDNDMAAEQEKQTPSISQDFADAIIRPMEQADIKQESPLLDQLRQQGDTITNRQAERIMDDPASIEVLRSSAGLDLSAHSTMSKRRIAVKQAFERYAREVSAQPTQDTVQDEQTVLAGSLANYEESARDAVSDTSMLDSFGENGRKAFVYASKNMANPESIYPEFSRAYVDGLTGEKQRDGMSGIAQTAYYAGKNDAAAQARAENAARQAGFSESEYSSAVSDSDRSFYNAIGKATGTNISIVAPTGEGGYNGYYQNGEIRIAADAEDPGRVVVAHEATHRLKEIAPDAYTKFRDYAVSAVAGQDGVETLIRAYQSRYAESDVTLTQEEAIDEIAADYAQRLMIDEDAIRRVVADDRGLAHKFLDTIKDLIKKVKKALSGKGKREELNRLETARDLWLNAIKEGSAVRETSGGADAKYSVKSEKFSAMEDETLDPNLIEPVNEVTSREMYEYLVNEFSSSGYYGRPIVVVNNGNNGYTALTGSHRIMAAREAGIDVPVVVVENQEAAEMLLDEYSDDQRAALAKELYEDGLLRENELNLIAREEELNSENFDVPYREQKRFSLKSQVETTKTLVALHNLTEEKLLASIRLGGFPMPSIAVTRTDIPHTNFGEISLVMNKSAIDPKSSRKNTVYSADAWTPTFPQVEYEADTAIERRISGQLNSLAKQIDDVFKQDLYRVSYDMNDLLNRYGGETGLIENVMDNYGLKAAYLEDKGQHISAVTTQRKVDKGYNPERAEKYQAVAEALGTSDPESIGQIPLKDLRDRYGDALEQAFPGITKSAFRMSGILRQVQEYFRDQGSEPAYETVVDYAATRLAIDNALDRGGYERWVLDLFSGIEAGSGIYNNKERFTPSGNRRSFQQTHYPVTLENIVKAMKGQNDGNTKNVSGFYGVKSLRAGTAQRFKSIADMHKLEGKLQNLTEKEVNSINDALDRRLIDISEEISTKSPGSFGSLDAIGNIMMEIADSGSYTIDSITRKFNEEYGYSINNELAAKVRDLLFDVSQMPVNIFEAKPERVVGFDEILAAVVPDNSGKELIDSLDRVGVQTIKYKAGDDAERLKVVNSIEPAKFSLKGASNLQRQVQNLEERNRYLQEQLKRTKGIKTDRKKTASFARNLITAYESKYDRDTLTGELLDIYDEIANSRDGVDMDGLRTKARDVAERVLEQSIRVDAEVYNEYSSLRNYLRTTKIKVPKSIHADLEPVGGYNGLRKGNSRRMKLSTTEGMEIDSVYRELAQQYPGLFDEQAYTNPADQLINISDVLNSIQPVVSNPYSSDMDMAARFVANEILEGYFDVPQQRPTFADRQEARVEAARAAGNRRLTEQRERSRQQAEELRQKNRDTILAERMAAGRESASMRRRYDQRIAQLRQQGREQVQNAVSRERQRRMDQVKAIKEKYASRDVAARERRNARDLRNRIKKHVQALSTRLLNPTDSRNVPEALRRPVAALLDAVNLESNYSLDPNTIRPVSRKDGNPGGITGKRLSADDERGVATKRTQAFIELRNAYQQIMNEGDGEMVIDPALLGDQASGFQGSFDKVISMHDKRLADMSVQELETVLQTVRAVEFSISTAGKNLAQSKFAGTLEWATAMREENRGKRPRNTTERHYTMDLLTPITYFSRFGDSGVAVYRMLRNAQDAQQQMITDLSKETSVIVTPAEAREMRYKTHQFTTQSNQELTLTTAQIMSLYELSKRKQAQEHIYTGGIYQPAVPGTKIKRGTEAIHLTPYDVEKILDTLTPDQIMVADKLQQIMSTTLADLGNDASMKAYGYKKFTGADYWPIKSAREGVLSTVENGGMNTRSIANIGLAKSTIPKANNPLDIKDAFTTFTEHAADMTDYAAYLLPMEDVNRLYNFRFKDSGQAIKGLLDRTGGPRSTNYWERLMEDIQNGTASKSDSELSSLAGKIMSRTKGASVGANLRVIAQQPTAYLRALAVLSPTNLSKGLAGGTTRGSGWAKALKWAPIAQKKQAGGFEIGSGVGLEQELFGDLAKGAKLAANRISDASMWGAGKMDEITWGKIWNACEWEVASKRKELSLGSDTFYKAVSELFTRVIDESQVVDGVMQRSQVMRSSSDLNKMATSFMGEPTMSLNLMMRSYDNAVRATSPAARSAARKKFARAGMALVLSGVVNAAVQSLVDAGRDDDKDKKYWERFISAFTGLTGEEESLADKFSSAALKSNVSGNLNPVGQIPYANDVLSMLQGYDVYRMDAEAIGDFITAGQNVVNNIGGTGTRTPAYALKELANAAAKVFGISVGNVLRDAAGILNSYAVETDDAGLMYEIDKVSYNISNSSNKSRFLDIAFKAKETADTETYNRIAKDLIAAGVLEDMDDFEDQMARRLKATGTFTSEQDKVETEISTKVQSSSLYKGIDEEYKEKLMDKVEAYSYAVTMQKQNPNYELGNSYDWVEKVQNGSSVGLTPDEYILFDFAYNNVITSDKDENGNSIPGSKQDKIIDFMEGMNLTDEEWNYLWHSVYTSDKNNPRG